MASNAPPLDSGSSFELNTSPNSNTIVLHILSPSLDAPNRITFNNLPLTTKISELKDRLYSTLANKPLPETQRLIYRGKPLTNNDEALRNIIEPADDHVHSMHLVLPPRSNIPGGSERPLSAPTSQQAFPLPEQLPNYLQQPNGLRFRGLQYGVNGATRAQLQFQISPQQLQTQIARLRQQAAPDPHASSRLGQGPQLGISTGHGHHLPASASQQPQILSTSSTPTGGQSRLPEMQQISQESRTDSPASVPSAESQTTPVRGSRNESMTFRPINENLPQRRPGSATPGSDSTVAHNPGCPAFATQRVSSYPNNRIYASSNPGIGLPNPSESRQLRLTSLLQFIIVMENQIRHGIIPSVDEISRLRSQLYQILDDQHRNPLGARDGVIEGLLGRLANIGSIADQLRISRSRNSSTISQHTLSGSTVAASYNSQHSVYLLSSPSGYHAVLMPPMTSPTIGHQVIMTPSSTVERAGSYNVGGSSPYALPQAPPGPAAVHQAINQALLQQRARTYLTAANITRNARRLWLFVRLYFFCYLLSGEGTWLRIVLVVLAAFTAILSETDVPRRLHRVVFDPLQRHLENLVPLEGHEQARPRPTPGEGNANNRPLRPIQADRTDQNPATAGAEDPVATDEATQGGLRQSLRRVERAVALFIASLVPGVGERHIAARNAAETARQNDEAARQEDERRRHDGGVP